MNTLMSTATPTTPSNTMTGIFIPTRNPMDSSDVCQPDGFYVYVDQFMKKTHTLPFDLENAYGDGFLVIQKVHSYHYYMFIGNQEYNSSSLAELESILYQWAIEEGYVF